MLRISNICSPIITKPAPKVKKEEPKAEEKKDDAAAPEATPEAEMADPDAATVEEIDDEATPAEPTKAMDTDDLVRLPMISHPSSSR